MNDNQGKIEKEDASFGAVLLKWQAPEFTYYPKTAFWYFWLIFIAALLAAFTLYTQNYSFGMLIVLSFILVLIWGRKKPRIIDFALTKQGIMVDKKLHRYPELDSFWIFYEPPVLKELSIKSKRKILYYLKMPLDRENPASVRKILIEFLPEEMQEESLFDSLARLAKF